MSAALRFPARWTQGELINPVTGILSGVWEQPRMAGYADLFQYAAMASNTGAFAIAENFRHVGGASLDRDAAWIKAVGEGVERYCAAIYDPHEFPLTTARKAPFVTVDPALLALYPDTLTQAEAFPFARLDADTPIRWCAAQTLAGDAVHVPAAGVYVPWYYDVAGGEAPIFQPISTGLACHGSRAAAWLGGLMEVVERDAFTILWQTRTPLRQIALQGLPPDSAEILRRIRATGAEVRIGFIATDHGIPVCIAAQHLDDSPMPAFSLAASAAATPADALRKALEELVHTFRWMARLRASRTDFTPAEDFANVVDQETHLLLWCDVDRRPQTAFLWSGERIAFADVPGLDSRGAPDQLDDAVARVEATGYVPLFRDLTTPDVGDLGFHVVRALVPGYNPLFMGHDLRSRTNPRLRAALGAGGVLNDHPHPFP